MAIRKNGIQGILYLTSVPKFKVVAPINKANNIEKKKQNITIGSRLSVLKNVNGPTRKNTSRVNNIRLRLSIEDNNVDNFLDSHI